MRWYVDDVFVFVGIMVLDTFYSHASNKILELTGSVNLVLVDS